MQKVPARARPSTQNLAVLPGATALAVTNPNLLTQSHPTALTRTISHTAITVTASAQAYF